MSKKVPRNREDSVINSLGNFIEVSRNHGVSDEIIYKLLKSRGWSTQDIESAFAIVIEKSVGFSIPSPSQPSGESSREAFLYLLSFVTIVKCEEKKLEEKHLGSKHGKTPRCFPFPFWTRGFTILDYFNSLIQNLKSLEKTS